MPAPARDAHRAALPLRAPRSRGGTAVRWNLLWAWLALAPASAQPVVHSNEHLDATRPEAWAMNYVGSATFMTSFGATPALSPWQWSVAADLANIPRLSKEQQRVGLHGIKQEDLNKSDVYGRLRISVGLPGEFVATLGWTPPLSYGGVQPLDLFAFSLGRRVFERDAFSVSMQLVGQHGRAQGDITCPATIAGDPDPQNNPFFCRAPSNDHFKLNYYGAEVVAAWSQAPWHVHASLGDLRTEFAVQVDAFTLGVHDRSYLTARGQLPFATFGASYDLDHEWSLSAEVLYVPLKVQRQIDGPIDRDPLTSVRFQLVYRFD